MPLPSITYNNVSFKIEDLTEAQLIKLQAHFKSDVPSAKFTWAYKQFKKTKGREGWDGTVTAIGDSTLTGLLPDVLELINQNVTLNNQRNMPLRPKLSQSNVPLRDYQYAAVRSAFSNQHSELGWWPRGVIHVATGGGKTEIAVAMYQMNSVPTFFLVHRKDLMFQAYERFKKYGIQAGLVGAGKWAPSDNLNIVTMQTLASVLKKKDAPTKKQQHLWGLIQECEQVFFDEAHLMASKVEKGNAFITISQWFNSAYCRWGLTATPFMRGQYDNDLLQGVTGNTLYKIGNQELIDAGYLSMPTIRIKRVSGGVYVPKMQASKMYQQVYKKGVIFHENRNNMIRDEIDKGPHPCLCLVAKVEHAEALSGATGSIILTGKASNDERAAAIAGVKAGKVKCIIATAIFDEGIDLPNIRKVILAGGGKSIVKSLQRVGRGLRKAEGKDTVEIVDFFDEHHFFLKNHSKTRMKLWVEQGFKTEME